MSELRRAINELDRTMLTLLAQRMDRVKELGSLKKEHGIPVIDLDREKELFAMLDAIAHENGLSSAYIRDLWSVILRESIRRQEEVEGVRKS